VSGERDQFSEFFGVDRFDDVRVESCLLGPTAVFRADSPGREPDEGSYGEASRVFRAAKQ